MFGLNRVRFIARDKLSKKRSVGISLLSLLLAFLTSGVMFLFTNVDPVQAYVNLFGAFSNYALLSEAIVRAIPIMFVALGLTIAYKANFISIGGEGQIYVGGIIMTGLVIWQLDSNLIPQAVFIPIAIIMVFFGTGLWGVIPAILKAKVGVNEVLTTLMMNYVAQIFSNFLVIGPWKDPEGHGFPLSKEFPAYARLGLIPGTTINVGILLGVFAALLCYVILSKTKFGFEVKVVGGSYQAARYAGISYTKVVCLGMLMSAGFAVLAGMNILSGVTGKLRPDFSPGYGYTAIIVAWLCNLNPIISIFGSIFFGGLLVGGEVLQASMNISVGVTNVFQALMLIFTLSGEFFKRYKIVWRSD
jgi:simple sugar transport system permease protein